MGMLGYGVALPPAKLAELQADPEGLEAFLFPDDGDTDPEHSLDLDKAWHAIHYLLTGEAWGGEPPLAWAVLGGEPFGPEIGYGPARALGPEQVAQVAQALAPLTPEALAARFDPDDMERQEIYPSIWHSEGAEALEFPLSFLPHLLDFYRGAAERGDAVILYLA